MLRGFFLFSNVNYSNWTLNVIHGWNPDTFFIVKFRFPGKNQRRSVQVNPLCIPKTNDLKTRGGKKHECRNKKRKKRNLIETVKSKWTNYHSARASLRASYGALAVIIVIPQGQKGTSGELEPVSICSSTPTPKHRWSGRDRKQACIRKEFTNTTTSHHQQACCRRRWPSHCCSDIFE